MYLKHFQLNTKPFQITADPRFLWLGEKHKEALATLRYGILDNRGFLLLTGEVGTGKTLLINRLIAMLDMDTVVATLPDPDLVSMDFYNLLADGLRMNRVFDSKGAFLIHLRDFLHQSYAERKQVLLIIDESQRLNPRIMEDIRVLSNIELNDRKLINIFFVGQEEFIPLLAAPQNRALAQRITVRYHIAPLGEEEVAGYVQHRIKVAGGTRKIFTASAIVEIFRFSGGIPRLINIVCDHALLTGYARDTTQIDDRIVKECAEELRLPFQPAYAAGNASDTKSITHAVARASADTAVERRVAREGGRGGAQTEDRPGAGASFWKVFFATAVLILLALTTYVIVLLTGEEKRRWSDPGRAPLAEMERTDAAPEPIVRPAESPAVQAPVEPDAPAAPAAVKKAAASNERRPVREPVKETPVIPGGDEAPPSLVGQTITVHFTLNSNEIDDPSYAALDRIAAFLSRNPEQIVHVRGYTDSSGSPGYNESVSRFRASAVKAYLVGKGAPADKIQIFSMGSFNPVASNDTAEGRTLNRRVEIQFPRLRPTDQ